MAAARVTSKGQITIPKKVRERLHLGPGDRVEFLIERGGKVSVRPAKRTIADLKGILRRPGQRAISVSEMDRAIARGHDRRS